MTQYKINEFFQTIQGEGYFTGVPAIFIRLQGCPVACPWCDTQQTWYVDPDREVTAAEVAEKKNDSDSWSHLTPRNILKEFKRLSYTAKHVVITGGEPCMYDLEDLTSTLIESGFSVQIETSGTFEIKAHAKTWVTVSPKVNMKGGYPILQSTIVRAQEIKHPVAMEKHVEELHDLLEGVDVKGKVICLQPISQGERATALATKVCIQNNWRLSIQSHKYLGIP